MIRRFAVGIAATAAVLGTVSGPAHAATEAVTVRSPSAEALVTSPQVAVRVDVAKRVTGVRVFAGRRELTQRFKRRGRSYRASLPASTFKPGEHTLLVEARRGQRSVGTSSVRFVLARPGKTRMTLTTGARAAAATRKAGGYAPRGGQLPVTISTRRAMLARLTVNGRRVESPRDGIATEAHHWVVSVRDGLRVGRNRISVEAYDRSGRYVRRTTTVTRNGTLPLAEAGEHERVVHHGRWTRLDATESRATRKGAGVRHRWRVVKAPAGAKPKLRDAGTARPRFKPDKPGIYQLALRTRHTRKTARAAATDGSEDVMTISSAPGLGDLGAYVATDLQFGSSGRPDTVHYNGATYPAADPQHPDVFLHIDPLTLDVLEAGDHSTVAPAPGVITVGVWNDTTVPYSSDRRGSMVWIDKDVVGANTAGNADGVGNPYSNLHGWLQPAVGVNSAKWVSSDFLKVSTGLRGFNTNTITVNGQAHTTTLPGGHIQNQNNGWFHVLALDNAGRAVWTPDPYVMPYQDLAAGRAVQDKLASDLNVWAGRGITLVIQAIDGIVGGIPDGSPLAKEIRALGGDPISYNQDPTIPMELTSDGEGYTFALIASQQSNLLGAKWTAVQTTGTMANALGFNPAGGRLNALMTRDVRTDSYVPFQSGAQPADTPAMNYTFLPLVYGAPTPFAGRIRTDDNLALRAATSAEQAALASIAAYADRRQWTVSDGDARCPAGSDAVRASYCVSDPITLANFKDKLSELSWNGYAGATKGFVEADFNRAKANYVNELADVAVVRSVIASYQGIFSSEDQQAGWDAANIGAQIQQLATRNQMLLSGQTQINPVDPFKLMLDVAGIIPGASEVTSALSAGLDFMHLLNRPTAKTPDVSRVDLEWVTETSIGSTIHNHLKAASKRFGAYADYLVQDPQKLLTGGYALSKGDLALTTKRSDGIESAAKYGLRQFLWGKLLSLDYYAYAAATDTSVECWTGDRTAIVRPFGNGDPIARIVEPDFTRFRTWWIAQQGADGFIQSHKDVALPRAISQPIFGAINPEDPNDPNAGADPMRFVRSYLRAVVVPMMNEGENRAGCWID